MKKVINKKVYDTEKAKYVAETSANCGVTDFGYWEETLYQKRTGEFFLFGKGGPMSRYAVSCGQNEWSGGNKIIPLTYDKAQEWAEENLSGDEYIEIFGDPEPENGREVLNISISSAIAQKIRSEAQKKGVTISALIAEKFVK